MRFDCKRDDVDGGNGSSGEDVGERDGGGDEFGHARCEGID